MATPRGEARTEARRVTSTPTPSKVASPATHMDDIAIVGLGTVMPDAPDVAQS